MKLTSTFVILAFAAALVVALVGTTPDAQESSMPPAKFEGKSEGADIDNTGEYVNMSDEEVLKLVSTPELDQCITTSLKTLASLQNKSTGSLGNASTVTATTALAGMAFLASGSTPNTGPYSKNIRDARDFLLNCQDVNTGFINEASDSTSRIHGHGYATMFLASCLGHSNGKDEQALKKALDLAVKCLLGGQTIDGGWGYYPNKIDFDEGSTTVCCLQGVRAARDAGIHVDKTVIANAMNYVNLTKEKLNFRSPRAGFQGQSFEGYTFMYSLASGRSSHSWALAAVSCSSLNNIGIYSGFGSWDKQGLTRVLHGGMRWLWHHADDFFERVKGPGGSLDTSHFSYAVFYATQAFWQYNNRSYFLDFFPKLRDLYLEKWRQNNKRGFKHLGYGDAYATAFALLSLQLPYQYLPAFQR